MRVWDGGSWVTPYFVYPKIWNGSEWVYGRPRIWSGTGWSMFANDSKTITVGSGSWSEPYVGSGTAYGYDNSGYYFTTFGGISPNANSPLTDESSYYTRVVYESGTDIGSQYYKIWLKINFNTSAQYNSGDWGWNTLNIGGYTYNRPAAAYTGGVGYSEWTWLLTAGDPNPFGTTEGATRTVIWS